MHFPFSISTIFGTRVDHTHPFFQYALFCLTRLAEAYQTLFYPETLYHLNVSTAPEYLVMCSELYEDLKWEERTIHNDRVDVELDERAKKALSDLSAYFWLKSTGQLQMNHRSSQYSEKNTMMTSAICGDMKAYSRSHSLSSHQKDASEQSNTSHDLSQIQAVNWNANEEELNNVYHDSLSAIITELERNKKWKLCTLYENQVRKTFIIEMWFESIEYIFVNTVYLTKRLISIFHNVKICLQMLNIKCKLN